MAGMAGLSGTAGTLEEPARPAAGAPPRAGLETADEPLGGPERPEFEPAGTGGEFSTSSTDLVEVVDFSPDRNETLLLEEVDLTIQANGAALVSVNGDQYGPFTGGVDVSIPFGGALLPYGGHVRALHRSTDGSETTTKVVLTGREV